MRSNINADKNYTSILELWKVAWPIILQGIFIALMFLIDTIMVSPLGSSAIISLGVANGIFLLFFSILIGFSNGMQVLLGYSFGANNIQKEISFFSCGLIASFLFSAIICLFLFFTPVYIVSLYTNIDQVINDTISYLEISCFVLPITAITLCISFFFRSQGLTFIPLSIFVLELPLNVLLNYMFIFGNFGVPSLGLEGAAAASLISRLFRLLCLVLYYISHPSGLKRHISVENNLYSERWKIYFKTSAPFIFTFLSLAIGGMTYQAIFGRLAMEDYAAYSLVVPWMNLGTTIINSLASACAVLASIVIGAGLYANVHKIAKFSLITVLLCDGILFLCFILLSLYPEAIYSELGGIVLDKFLLLLPMSMVFLIFKGITTIMSNGIFKVNGNAKFGLFCELCTQWIVTIPLCAALGLLFEKTIDWLFLIIIMEQIILLIIYFYKFRNDTLMPNESVKI